MAPPIRNRTWCARSSFLSTHLSKIVCLNVFFKEDFSTCLQTYASLHLDGRFGSFSTSQSSTHKKYSGLKTQTFVRQSVVLFLANLLFLFFHRHPPVASKSFEYFWNAHTCQCKLHEQTSEALYLHHILTEVFHENNLYKFHCIVWCFLFSPMSQ